MLNNIFHTFKFSNHLNNFNNDIRETTSATTISIILTLRFVTPEKKFPFNDTRMVLQHDYFQQHFLLTTVSLVG